MLKSHFSAVENQLLAISRIPANAGHPLHKGTPREAFIKEFLASHLSETVAIGTGEIIDQSSKPDEPRNQMDIVIYRRDYPKLDLGGGINVFLAESVVATVEVKSVLDKNALEQSIKAARNVKRLIVLTRWGKQDSFRPPSILNYVVAYDGPANMQTVYGWLEDIHSLEGIRCPAATNTGLTRLKMVSPSLDAIFVLGRGFVQFDNMPISFLDDETRTKHPDARWVIANSPDNNLFLMFLFLTNAVVNGSPSNEFNTMYPLVAALSMKEVYFGT
jgi:hypothetical protein